MVLRTNDEIALRTSLKGGPGSGPKKGQGQGLTKRQGITMSMDPDVSAQDLANKFTSEQLRELSESPMADKKKILAARLLREKKK